MDLTAIDASFIIQGLVFVAAVGALFWRVGALEKRMDKNAEIAREDRKAIHGRINNVEGDLREVKGELRGAGYINGHNKKE